MVTPYPPVRDGIGAYAVHQVKRLRAEGHDVEVLSPGPSAAHHHLDLRSTRGPLALAKRARAYDKLIIQYHPDVFYPYPSTMSERLAITAGLIAVMQAAPEVEVRVHEFNYELGTSRKPDGVMARRLWRMPDRIVVHTPEEQRGMTEAYGLPPGRVELADHGAHFDPRTTVDRAAARARLGIDPDAHVFLSIGFIQPHKGFDRSVHAFAGMAARGAELHVVGSVRVEEPDFVAHLAELRRLVAATPGAFLHDGYLSDEAFDIWLVAADTIVLPYRFIWSSGVMERARLYGRPVIATRVGGLADQAPAGTVLVDDDDALGAAMRAALGEGDSEGDGGGEHAIEPPVAKRQPWPGHGSASVDRDAVMAEVRARAALRRTTAAESEHLDAGDQARRARASAPLRQLPRMAVPAPASARSSSALVKRVVAKLTGWQVDAIVHQINSLQDAAIEAAEDASAPPDSGG
jgi:glycosyltransferase involved in cell wall biosynthesis